MLGACGFEAVDVGAGGAKVQEIRLFHGGAVLRIGPLCFALYFAVAMVWTPWASAGSLLSAERKEIVRLTRLSDRIVIGEVIHVRIEVKPGGVYTVSTMLIEGTLKGDRAPVVEVRLPGGKLGDRTFRNPGGLRLDEKQRVLVFLSGDRLTGSAEGAFYLDEEGRAMRNHIALYNQGHKELNRYDWKLADIRDWIAREND